MEKTYTVQAYCSNCNWEGQLEVPVGVLVEKSKQWTCPNCKTCSLRKY